MSINCHNCGNNCCQCSGCQPQQFNGNWYCPRCIENARKQLMVTNNNNQVNWQPIINSTRQR